MNGELDKQAIEKLKEEIPGLFRALKKKKKTREEIAAYLGKPLDVVNKWAQGKSAPINEEVESVVKKLKELLDQPSFANEANVNYKTNKVLIFIRRYFPILPSDLIDFWNKQYKNTFQLYNHRKTFSILKPAAILEEISTLRNSYPKEPGMYSQIYKLLPIAKDNEDNQGSYLVHAFDNTDKNLGIYLWVINGGYEYPIFIANSVKDLINDHIITLEGQDDLHFDSEKYLNDTFEKNTKGYVLPLTFKANFTDANDIHTRFKKLIAFYETAFKTFHGGTIIFEATGELLTVIIKNEYSKTITYNIKDEPLFLFIEKLNDELNGIDKSNFCRPVFYGYYLINEEYVACLRHHIATELIQKGYINSRFKLLPKLAFYNPTLDAGMFNHYRMLNDMDKKENQKIKPV